MLLSGGLYATIIRMQRDKLVVRHLQPSDVQERCKICSGTLSELSPSVNEGGCAKCSFFTEKTMQFIRRLLVVMIWSTGIIASVTDFRTCGYTITETTGGTG